MVSNDGCVVCIVGSSNDRIPVLAIPWIVNIHIPVACGKVRMKIRRALPFFNLMLRNVDVRDRHTTSNHLG